VYIWFLRLLVAEIIDETTYTVHLPQFEGPFDLLLFFIQRDELDIHDIPIARITQDFLEYLHHMQRANIELASDFIVTAAQLMKIKAKMLIPRYQVDDQGQPIDPRTELVDRLLLYKAFKDSIEQLQELEEAQTYRIRRGAVLVESEMFKQDSQPEDELYGLTIFQLHRAYQQALLRAQSQRQRPVHVIQPFPYSLEEVKAGVIASLTREPRIDFIRLATQRHDKLYVVFLFLGVLELLQQRRIGLVVGDGYNNFWLTQAFEAA